jgi:hypothetical protein
MPSSSKEIDALIAATHDWRGATLATLRRIIHAMLNGKTRAIDVHEGDTVNTSALKALIRAGVTRRLAKLKLVRNRR